ncbi:MAG: amidohydrolase [SAR202 cluster bacterium]|nr:amidohydrolase [SAR202 cluster bacterium]
MARMNVAEIKAAVVAEIDRRGDEAVKLAKEILANPEGGFREHKTSRRVAEKFRELGIPFQDGIAITGLKGMLNAESSGPTVGVMGELDSLYVLGHPHADPTTSAAHACGHHAQIGSMVAAGIGLKAAGVLESLSGRVALMAAPAEEYVEIEYRNELRKKGKVEFLGGKPEFIRTGALDDVDIAMMTHTEPPLHGEGKKLAIGATNTGMVAKFVQFQGKAAHAGGHPHLGINALNAANIALMAIHAQRETFRDEDTVRVHPIITRGGASVNSVPADVRMETFVRAKTIDAYLAANRKIDRALRAGAMAVGGSVTITTLPGYIPLNQDRNLQGIYEANAVNLVGSEGVAHMGHRTGSTDMGDVCQIMPAIHPYVIAATGVGHGNDYLVADYELGVKTAGKAMALTVVDLLADGARKAKEVKKSFKAPMTKAEYLAFMRSLVREETFTE